MPRVDVHTHLFPDEALARLPAGLRADSYPDRDQVGLQVEGGPSAGRGAPAAVRSVEAHRTIQAEHGIDVSIVSAWTKLTSAVEDPALEADLCQVVNEELSAQTAERDGYEYLASIPVLDGGRAADELERALTEGAVGGLVTANPHNGSLGRADLDRLWEVASREGAPLLVHPGYFIAPERLSEYFFGNIIGYPFETTLAAASLIASGVVDRHPDLQVVLVHGGGFLPYQYGRLVAGLTRREIRTLSADALDYVRWFHFESIVFEREPLRYLLDLVGPDRVLAGTDCPFSMRDHSLFDDGARLGLDADDTARVLGGNACRLFGLPDGEGAIAADTTTDASVTSGEDDRS